MTEDEEFTPRILQKTFCGFCEAFHPTKILCADGSTKQFLLKSFHVKPEMLLDSLGITEREPTTLERCVSAQMDVKGYSQEQAEEECKVMLEDPFFRHSFLENPTQMDCYQHTQSEEDKFVAQAVSTFGWHPELASLIYWKEQRELPKFPVTQKKIEGLDDIYVDGRAKTKDELIGDTTREPTYQGRLTVGDLYGESMRKKARRRQEDE